MSENKNAETLEVAGYRCNGINISGKRFSAKFINPGLVGYEQEGYGISLLKKETIDANLDSFIGKPVTIEHPKRGEAYKAVGQVDMAEYNSKDGWYWCGGELTDDSAISMVNGGGRVSCGYTIPAKGEMVKRNSRYNNVPYDSEITNLRFTHLAIVQRPRYEEAGIRLNSIPVEEDKSNATPIKDMFKLLKNLVKRDKNEAGEEVVTNAVEEVEVPADTKIVGRDGTEVTLSEVEDMRQRLNSALEQSKKLNEEIENVRKNAAEAEKKIVTEIPAKPAEVAPVVDAGAGVSPEAGGGVPSAQQASAIKAAVDAALRERSAAGKPDYFEMLRSAQFGASPSSETKFFGTLEEQLARGRAIFSKDK